MSCSNTLSETPWQEASFKWKTLETSRKLQLSVSGGNLCTSRTDSGKKKKELLYQFPIPLARERQRQPKGARRSQRADIGVQDRETEELNTDSHPSSLQASSLKEAKRADRAEALLESSVSSTAIQHFLLMQYVMTKNIWRTAYYLMRRGKGILTTSECTQEVGESYHKQDWIGKTEESGGSGFTVHTPWSSTLQFRLTESL